MNIEKKQMDELNLQLTLTIGKDDYADMQRKKLNERRRTADFKGFRRGMAPMSLVERIYGEQVLVETINSLLSQQLDGYIRDHQLHILGEPLPSKDQPENSWTPGSDFVFKFDLGLSPALDFKVGKEDKVPYYEINITEKARKEMKANLLRQYGQLEEGKAAKEDDYIVADLDNGEVKVEGAYISLRNVAEACRKDFIGLKAGKKIAVNVNEAFENETDRAAMLKIKKEELAALNPAFQLNVVHVKTFVPATESQETWDKMFGEGVVTTPEQFEAKIEERLRDNHRQQADYRLSKDLRDHFLAKANLSLPEEFLKRWLYSANDGKFSMEDIEKDFSAFAADFRWQLVRGYLMRQFGLSVEEKDIREAAEAYTAYQYAMYGLGNVPQEMIREAANRMLSDERQIRQLEEQVEDNKTLAALREKVSLQTKKISEDKFRELK